MNIVCTADLHLHPWRLCSLDGGKDRLRDGLSVLRQTLGFAQERGCPWVFAGDMKVPKLSWPQEALTGALELFDEYADVEKLMIPGNHDGDASHIGGSGLAPFHKHAMVVEKPCVVELSGGELAVAPWQAKRSLEGMVSEAAKRRVRVLLSHGFLAGTLLGPDETRLPGKGLALADLGIGEAFDLALMGDVHKGQRLVQRRNHPPTWESWAVLAKPGKSPRVRAPAPWGGEVVYAGSPYQQTWGERNDGPKGAILVDLQSGAIDLLETVAPRYRLVELPELKFDAMERVLKQAGAWQGDFVLARISEVALRGAGQGFVEKLREASQARWFHVAPIRGKKTEQRSEVHMGMGQRELLEAYMKARPYEGPVPAPQILAAGLQLAISKEHE